MSVLGISLPKFIADDDARKLLEEELSKNIYKEKSESIIEKIINFIYDLIALSWNNSSGTNKNFIDWMIIIILILIVSGIIYSIYRIRKKYPNKNININPLLDDRSYQQLVLSAKNAIKANDYATGVLETYRAIIKYLHISNTIYITKNMTANEATEKIIEKKPEFSSMIRESTIIFNRVMYGDRLANYQDYNTVHTFLSELTEKIPLYEKSYEGFGYGGIH